MNMPIPVLVLATLFEVIIILWQLLLISHQNFKEQEMKKENSEWKNQVESLINTGVKEVIEQNKKVLEAFNSFINNENKT